MESAGATGQTSLTYPDTIDANGYGIYYFTWLKPVAGKLARSFGISASQTTDLRVSNTVGTWENLSALISRIDITTGASGFIANTRFVLEGRTS